VVVVASVVAVVCTEEVSVVVSEVVALVLEVFVAALWLPNVVVALASADQPVHSDTTTEAVARLLLGHTNSADGETNR
jgi:hypothetical protein